MRERRFVLETRGSAGFGDFARIGEGESFLYRGSFLGAMEAAAAAGGRHCGDGDYRLFGMVYLMDMWGLIC